MTERPEREGANGWETRTAATKKQLREGRQGDNEEKEMGR